MCQVPHLKVNITRSIVVFPLFINYKGVKELRHKFFRHRKMQMHIIAHSNTPNKASKSFHKLNKNAIAQQQHI